MTGVFSGGLVYEYSEEGNGYGLVQISGNSVSPVGQQFTDLQQELAKAKSPSGGAGFSANNQPQQCPGQSQNWDTKPFTGSNLPATPSGALKYFKNGARKGPGLSGKGSQNAAGGSTTTAAAGAGSVSATYGSAPTGVSSSASSSSAASGAVPAHMVHTAGLGQLAMCGVVVAISIAFGTMTL